MIDPTMKDVMEMLKSITTEMSTMKADMAALKEQSAESEHRYRRPLRWAARS
jgi:hypothetical protein